MTKLWILNENRAGGHGCLGEHGLSILIESDDATVLFDTGPSATLLENARRLGLSLELDWIALSHGHRDHTGGLKALLDSGLALPPVIAHPCCFVKRIDRHGEDQSAPFSLDEALKYFDLKLTTTATPLSESITFLTSIPRVMSFENDSTGGYIFQSNGTRIADHVPDDSALTVRTSQGLVVVCGCAHAGLINTLIHVRQLWGDLPILSVVGGFHLTSRASDERLQQTIRYIKGIGVQSVYPCHCVNLRAMAAFYEHFGIDRIGAGIVLTL